MRLGRPKKYQKREERRKAVRLSEEAYILFSAIKEKRPLFDFSRYVSERIIMDFNSPDKILKEKIVSNQKMIDALYQENNKIAAKLKEIQDKQVIECFNS